MISRFSRPLLMIVLLGSSLLTRLEVSALVVSPVRDRFAGSIPNTNSWLINQDQGSTNDQLLQDKGLHFIVPTIGSANSDTWIWKNNLPTNSDWSITLNVENLATSPFTNSFAGIGLNVGDTNNASSFAMDLSYNPAEGGVLWESALDAGSNSSMTTTNPSVRKGGLLLNFSALSGTVTEAYCLHPEV